VDNEQANTAISISAIIKLAVQSSGFLDDGKALSHLHQHKNIPDSRKTQVIQNDW